MVNLVELVLSISFPAMLNQLLQTRQKPTIDEWKFSYVIGGWIVAIKVRQKDSERVADPSVGVCQLIEHLFSEGDFVGIVDAGYPEPDDIRSVFVDVVIGFRRLRVAALLRFRNLLPAIHVHDETVSQDFPIRSLAADGNAGHKRGLEPPPVLIGGFDVDIRR